MPNPSAQNPRQPPAQAPEPPAKDSTPKGAPPKDPSVYGGQWGGDGNPAPGPPPPDRPDKIKPPAEKN